MKKMHLPSRLLSLLLVVALLCGFAVPVDATGADSARVSFEKVDNSAVSASLLNGIVEDEPAQPGYADTDVVRISIVLEKASTIGAGFSAERIARNAAAVAYRADLAKEQESVTAKIEKTTGNELDVVWNLTLAANIISANVRYGQIEAIEKVPGVAQVLIETRYEPDVVDREESNDPNMATSGKQIGSAAAWAEGYTGTGSRIAVIDTGIDTTHQSFNAEAFQYSLAYWAGESGKTVEEYLEGLNLLDAEGVAAVADELNAGIDPQQTYISSKIPYAYNYIDEDYDIIHANDIKGEHGSHVEGIAAANAWLAKEDGTFVRALDEVGVQGVAPDAQILTMKVFGKGGGAYDSDYMAAIEDAIVLGADSINLSLGSGNPGMSRSSDATYQAIMDNLTNAGAVVCISAGNSGSWVENAQNGGYLYADDVSMQTSGSPGSFTNSLAVASVDNDGLIGAYVTVGDRMIVYSESDYKNEPMATIAGYHEYVFIDGFGTEEDWAAIGNELMGKIALCSRGSIAFWQKVEFAAKAGAIATIIYNNTSGIINMDLTDYTQTAPAVSITQVDGAAVKAASTPVTDDEGNVLYYTGTMYVADGVGSAQLNSDHYTMSAFSSWGVPGSLELKPEITAPGGSIYSVNGTHKNAANGPILGGSDAYEVMSGTSMASPQVAGMAALAAQYIRENGLEQKTGLTTRQLTQSLLMSTAEPIVDGNSGCYYPVLQQGAGLGNVGNVTTADSYILMDESATKSWADGKVKVELGDDPQRNGSYSFGFSVNNLTGSALNYTLDADFFTQDLFSDQASVYMNTLTTMLPADVTYTVDGVSFVPVPQVICDLDNDGDTDADDAQIILNYVAGLSDSIDEIADLDGDDDITTNDAYILLDAMETRNVVVPAGGSVDIVVNVSFPQSVKAYLDSNYEGGAYVEGYVYVKPVTTEEGIEGVTHSIPVLGFYGSWTDASMYDHTTYTDYLYGDTTVPYLGSYATNNLIIKYPGDTNEYYQVGNPYMLEDSYPEGRAAVSSGTTLSQYRFALIRNAAALAMVVSNEDGKVLSIGPVSNQWFGAYYHVNGGAWKNTSATYTFNKKVNTLGVSEGDVINVSLVAIPEYYENGAALTAEDVTALIESGMLGDGAYLTSTMVVDDTAPVITGLSRDLLTGNLIVTASDNNYIASLQVLSKGGSLYAKVLPEATEKGQVTTTIDLTGVSIGTECLVAVYDYAGNESVYQVAYGGEPEDYTGRMYGFTSSSARGSGQRWVEIDPEHVYYRNSTNNEGMTSVIATDVEVYAAEYVDGYVFFATDNAFYAAVQGEWTNYQKVADFPEDVGEVRDMAFNYQNNMLYFLDSANTVYALDTNTGDVEKIVKISVSNPKSTTAIVSKLSAMTIDDEGNFYAVNYGSNKEVFLYTWTLGDVMDGVIKDLAPKFNNTEGYLAAKGLYSHNYESLAWDHDKDILYFAAGYDKKTNSDEDNELWVIDVETGKAGRVSNYSGGSGDAYIGRLQAHVVGLYVVPSASQAVKPTDKATSITISSTELTVVKGSAHILTAEVKPWTLTDKSVTWSSSDPEILSVENGMINALAAGEATITVTTVAEPHLTASCVVTVETLDNIKLSGLVYDTDGATYWSEFETDTLPAWNRLNVGGSYYAGTLHEGKLVVHSGDAMFGIDPDTFEVTTYGEIASTWIWSDAAECPAQGDLFGRILGLCNGGQYLEMINPADGTLSYWNLSKEFADDPMAAIAYAGSGTYDYNKMGVWFYPDCPARFYYMMTESGALYKFTIFTDTAYTLSNSYTIINEKVGNTGMNLNGVSAVTGGQYASMVYDQETGCLLVSSYQEGDVAQLYAVSPEVLIPALIGEFGDNVYPVVCLYQYDRATDLTVKLSTSALSLYAEDTVTIGARVLLGETGELTWSTSDASVATVENGVVTGVGGGTATITATTVDVNSAGEHVSATVEVTVKPLTAVTGTVTAQVTTESGSAWVDIDLATKTTTVKKSGATTMRGGGYSVDAIYATDAKYGAKGEGNVFRIDANTFEERKGAYCISEWAPLDVADSPATTFTFTDKDGTQYTANAFGYPFFISNMGAAVLLMDWEVGQMNSWLMQFVTNRQAAVAYIGSFDQPKGSIADGFDAGTTAHQYLVLTADGSILSYEITPGYNPAAKEGKEVGYNLAYAILGNIGMAFDDFTSLSMDYVELGEDCYGLLIADSTTGSIYFANLAGETYTCNKVCNIDGITGITALHKADVSSITMRDANENLILRKGDAVTSSSPIAMAAPLPETVAAVDGNISAAVNVDQTGGSTNAISGRLIRTERAASVQETGAVADDGAVTLTLTEDQNVTNGLIKVTYDPQVLTYSGVSTILANYAVNNNAENGTIYFDYATAKVIAAGNTLAALNFTYEAGYINTTVTVETLERNTQLNITGESAAFPLTYEVGGDHDYQVTESREPTCLEPGYKVYTCAKCGDSYRVELDALGHDWSDWAATKAATCTEDGVETRTCEHCDAIETREIPATGHVWGEWTVTKEAGCFHDGEETRICSVCGETETRVIESNSDNCPSDAFTDLDTGLWYHESVDFVLDTGLMNGVGGGLFQPNGSLTRGQMVTILYRMADKPAVSEKAPFTDVAEGRYYTDAVAWAYEKGIAKGVTGTAFAPEDPVTREQMVTFLARYAQLEGADVTVETEPGFPDAESVSDFAKAPVAWAVENGIIQGMGGRLNPKGTATRAQIAAIIMRYCKNF